MVMLMVTVMVIVSTKVMMIRDGDDDLIVRRIKWVRIGHRQIGHCVHSLGSIRAQ